MAVTCARLTSADFRAAPSVRNASIPKQSISCSIVIVAPDGNALMSRDTFVILATIDRRKFFRSCDEYHVVDALCSFGGTMYNSLDTENVTVLDELAMAINDN